MFALSNRRRLVGVGWLTLGALTYACSFNPRVDTAGAPCVQGQSASCACANGSLGVVICGTDSAFGECQCGAPSSAGSGGGLPVGGSAGNAGSDVGDDSDDGPGAGDGPDPVVDAGGTAGSAAAGGMTGSGDGGMMAGTGGSGGSTGAAGAAGDSTGGPAMEEPNAGEEPYAACRDDGSCDLPMFCMFDASSGGAERYCTAACNGNGFGALSCPLRSDGSRPLCVRNFCVR